MFGNRAFRTWPRIVVGASGFAVAFVGIMVMGEAVVGDGPRLGRAAATMGLAAFLGYVGTAWIVRHDDAPTP
jgi:uncharacterized membrane protein YqjE